MRGFCSFSEVCEDKPGIDCKLLNATNICANPFSHQYCAAFCGHCTATIDTVFGQNNKIVLMLSCRVVN